MPAVQFVQLEAPTAAPKVPAGHVAHVAAEVAPEAVEKVPATQLVQLEAPAAVPYEPGAHGEQAEAPGPAKEPAAHVAHTAAEVAEVAAEAVPGEHCVQAEALAADHVPAPPGRGGGGVGGSGGESGRKG